MDERTGEVVLSPDRPKPRKPGTKRGPRKEKKGAVPDVDGDVVPLVPDQDISGLVEQDAPGAQQVSSSGAEEAPVAEEEMPVEDRPEMHTPKAPAVRLQF